MTTSTAHPRLVGRLALIALTATCGLLWVITSWLTQLDLARLRFERTADLSMVGTARTIQWYQVASVLAFPAFVIGFAAYAASFMIRVHRRTA